MFILIAMLLKEILTNTGHTLVKPIAWYGRARRSVHFTYTLVIVTLEFALIMFVHDEVAHMGLAATVASWESLVVAVSE